MDLTAESEKSSSKLFKVFGRYANVIASASALVEESTFTIKNGNGEVKPSVSVSVSVSGHSHCYLIKEIATKILETEMVKKRCTEKVTVFIYVFSVCNFFAPSVLVLQDLLSQMKINAEYAAEEKREGKMVTCTVTRNNKCFFSASVRDLSVYALK